MLKPSIYFNGFKKTINFGVERQQGGGGLITHMPLQLSHLRNYGRFCGCHIGSAN